MSRRRSAEQSLLVVVASIASLSAACTPKKTDPTPATVDAETASRLNLTEDAKDPTVRDLESGYDRWRPKPEPEGTASPMSPARRKIDRRP